MQYIYPIVEDNYLLFFSSRQVGFLPKSYSNGKFFGGWRHVACGILVPDRV